MKRLLCIALVFALLGFAAAASAQTTMTTAQKIKLIVVPTPAGAIPEGTFLVWSVEGDSPQTQMGIFDQVPGEFAVYYLPQRGGSHVVRVSLVVDGQTTGASIAITVTVPPLASVTITAGVPIPR